MSVNKVILVGNVGKDPEVKFIESGIAVARFPLATTEVYYDKNKNNEKKEITEWHNIVLWRGLAETAQKYVKKGKQLYIEGRIQTRSYEKEGQKLYFTEIVANNMIFLGKKDAKVEIVSEQPKQETQSDAAAAEKTPVDNLIDSKTSDQIPF